MKKWIPFIAILLIAGIALFDLLLFSENLYQPTTADPQIIYYEACASCHGDNGKGDDFLYPSLINESLSVLEIETIIVEGTWRMPHFRNIKNDTLSALVTFIHQQNFEN